MAIDMLTTLAPITPGHEGNLRRALAGFDHHSPLADVRGTHTGRWVIMKSFGTGDQTARRRLRPALLLFSAVVDGPVEAWLLGLFEGMGTTADRVWGHCSGWPGSAGDAAACARWLLAHRVPLSLPFLAYEATRADIESSLEARRKLAELAPLAGLGAKDEAVGPKELRHAYHSLFGSTP